jgi:hypothetical protein
MTEISEVALSVRRWTEWLRYDPDEYHVSAIRARMAREGLDPSSTAWVLAESSPQRHLAHEGEDVTLFQWKVVLLTSRGRTFSFLIVSGGPVNYPDFVPDLISDWTSLEG